MSNKGGYKIINFRGKSITVDSATGVEIPGIYESLEGNYHKATLASGLVTTASGTATEHNDQFVNFTLSGTDFVTSIGGYTITIDDDDKVKATTPVSE